MFFIKFTTTLLLLTNLSFASNSAFLDSLQLQAQEPEEKVVVEQSWLISPSNKQKIMSARLNQSIQIPQFPQLVQSESQKSSPLLKDIKLTRYNLMAPGAEITAITDQGKQIIEPLDVMAFSAAEYGLGLLVKRKTADVSGLVIQDGISFTIQGNLQTGLDFRVNSVVKNSHDASSSCATAIENQPGDPLADMRKALKSKSLAPKSRGTISYESVLALDTDKEWMAGKSNNTTTAMNYINTLFVNMNVFFERDASLRFLMGDVTLRINEDPFTNVGDISDALTDFGEEWRTENSSIDRDFAALLSGRSIGSNGFSGIAWVDQYCEKGFVFNGGTVTAGSYSVNRIGTNAGTGFISQFLAHEIGHNLGSPHTHCYDPAIDNCYNGEGGCFDGTPVCPAGGKGTIMSYCHVGGGNGASCGTSDDEFHPTVINLFDSRLASNSPSCIAPFGSDLIFADGFE